MVLGAEGVMMASRFIATTECLVHERVKEELVQRQENDTVMICRSINLQMRALRNPQVEKVLEVEARRGGLEEIIPLIAGKRQSAGWETGDVECSPFPVGQSIGLIEDVARCEELLWRMMREAGEILARVQERFVGDPAS